jgi:hypothetical protein
MVCSKAAPLSSRQEWPHVVIGQIGPGKVEQVEFSVVESELLHSGLVVVLVAMDLIFELTGSTRETNKAGVTPRSLVTG